MDSFISYFLIVYFLLFFGFAFAWRTYQVWRRTDINAFRLKEEHGPEQITGIYFRILPLLSVLSAALWMLGSKTYQYTGPLFEITGSETIKSNVIILMGMSIMIIALIWIIWAQASMGNSWRIGIDHEHKTELVTAGIYQWSRNPIFLGMILCLAGYFLVLPNVLNLVTLLVSVVLIQVQVSLEESYLLLRHGEDYEKYSRLTSRWFSVY